MGGEGEEMIRVLHKSGNRGGVDENVVKSGQSGWENENVIQEGEEKTGRC